MQFKRSKKIVSPPDITPMIDVVFLLLIFFMLSTTFIVKPGIDVSLPKASAEQITKAKEELTVTISNNGDIYVKEKKVGLDELDKIFINAAVTSKESIVIINADEHVTHGRVVEIMDRAKGAGISKLAVATEQKKN
ncbi:MAG: biopolymer transporter ExbD [Proteobacteria bacterium]|nr:biopolymer transporter ExbD [Pseudomonadota bacterium]